MFDKLEDLEERLAIVLEELNDPDVTADQGRFRSLMKEQNELTPIVEAYRQYKGEKQNIQDSLEMIEQETDDEMKELAREELAESKEKAAALEEQIRILLIPKDPNDEKNVIV